MLWIISLSSPAFAQTVLACDGINDTTMLNDAFASGDGGTFCVTGTCLSENLDFSPKATSSAPGTISITTCGGVQAGAVPPTFVAMPDITGTFITAHNLANTGLAHVAITCPDTLTTPCLDTSWDIVGPSIANHYTDVWVHGLWKAWNNNDAEFDHISATQLDITACGGMVAIHDSFFGLLNLCAQNARIASTVGHGINLGDGWDNLVLSGDYLYADTSTGHVLWNSTGQGITALTSLGTLYVGTGPNQTAFDVKIGKKYLFGNQFNGIKQ